MKRYIDRRIARVKKENAGRKPTHIALTPKEFDEFLQDLVECGASVRGHEPYVIYNGVEIFPDRKLVSSEGN